jgi:hypothetical protein
MNATPNIYSAVVFDLHPKVKAFIDGLNEKGQIDLSPDGYPWLLSVNKTGNNITVKIVRNGQQESAIMNTRKRADPILSWTEDGYQRAGGKKVISVNTGVDKQRPERAKRPSTESFRRLADQMIQG